jgi:hypothetical protein
MADGAGSEDQGPKRKKLPKRMNFRQHCSQISEISVYWEVLDNRRWKDHYHSMRVFSLLAPTLLAIIGLFAIPALSQGLQPERFPQTIPERVRYSDIVCSATIVKSSQAGNPINVDGEERSQWIATATIDRIFKGTLDSIFVEFKYYGYIPPPGVFDIQTPAMADFRPGFRYVIFLNRHGLDLEVSIPVYQMEIELAPRRPTLDESNFDPPQALAKELVYAVQSEPDTIGRALTHYYDWIEELIGKQAIPLAEPFLNSSDPIIRYQAAWWLSFRQVNNVVINELNNAMQDECIEEWARSGARDRLIDMAAGRYLP